MYTYHTLVTDFRQSQQTTHAGYKGHTKTENKPLTANKLKSVFHLKFFCVEVEYLMYDLQQSGSAPKTMA